MATGKSLKCPPDPQYALKKRQRNRLIDLIERHPDWVFGFLDEVWWSRLQLPHLHSWSDDAPLRLVTRTADKTDPDPKAIACYGVWLKAEQQMLLHFSDHRPGARNHLCLLAMGFTTGRATTQTGSRLSLGQCHLASIATGSAMGQEPQCSSETDRKRHPIAHLSASGEESLAQ